MSIISRITAIAFSTMCVAAVLIVASPSARADTRADRNGLRWRSDDRSVQLRLGGRLHYDVAWFDSDLTPFSDDGDIRRFRYDLGGRVGDDWSFKLERDDGGTVQGWKSVWLAWRGIKHLRLSVGNQVAPFGNEQRQSSNSLLFMERSLGSALAPNFLTGLQGRYARGDWTATLGYFSDPLGDKFGQNNASGQGPIARVTFAPQHRRFRTTHFGVSFQHRSLDAGSEFRLRARPESGLADAVLLDTGRIVDADAFTAFGGEALWRYRRWSAQGEYLRTRVTRNIGPSVDFDRSYLQIGYVLTGESRHYSRALGTFGGVRPRGPYGAFELAVRYSDIDLQDRDIRGGRGHDLGLGLNWTLTRNLGFSLNYIRAWAQPNRRGADEVTDIVQLRALVHF